MRELTRREKAWIWYYVYVEHRIEFSQYRFLRSLGRMMYLIRRFFQGAKRVKPTKWRGEYELPTAGSYSAKGVHVDFGSACPVQGEGTVDGRECYYRSRGEGWQFHVAPVGSDDVFSDDAFVYEEYKYYWPDGGWVSAERSCECIALGVKKFRESEGKENAK